jgi:hypothetical protein
LPTISVPRVQRSLRSCVFLCVPSHTLLSPINAIHDTLERLLTITPAVRSCRALPREP